LGVRLAPYGRVPKPEAQEAFAEQIKGLVDGGADLLILETHSDVAELEQAVLAARAVSDLPVIASLTFTRDDRTLLGESPEAAARKLAELEVDMLGVNCSEGPEQVLRLIMMMKPHANGIPLVAQPNAGGPQRLGGRIMFSATPEYFGEYATAFVAAGVRIVGGCCGTQPAHIRAMAQALAAPARPLDIEVEEHAAEPAAYALGIRNIFAVMGDSTSIGDFPEATDLSDVTPSGLIALVKGSLNAGLDRAGSSIGDPTSFVVACALNVTASDLDREARVLKRKIDAGADYAITQAIFDADRLDRFRSLYEERYGPLELPILGGVLPIASRRHAEFLHNEVPGIDIPDAIRKRIGKATDERAEGLAVATELCGELRARVAGLYLIPPFRRYDHAAELIELVRNT
jgi:5,10-methylenetetrahydrofolate reductase